LPFPEWENGEDNVRKSYERNPENRIELLGQAEEEIENVTARI